MAWQMMALGTIVCTFMGCSSDGNGHDKIEIHYKVDNQSQKVVHLLLHVGADNDGKKVDVQPGTVAEDTVSLSEGDDDSYSYRPHLVATMVGGRSSCNHNLDINKFHSGLADGQKVTVGYKASPEATVTRAEVTYRPEGDVSIPLETPQEVYMGKSFWMIEGDSPVLSELWFLIFPTSEILPDTTLPPEAFVEGDETAVPFSKSYKNSQSLLEVEDKNDVSLTCSNAGCVETP